MSLRTGASLATLSLLLNKVSGLYGLLALLTGLHLSPIQLSMYIYSLVALCITAYLAPHIRTQSPFYCLALAWFYVFDAVINAVYTIVFAVTWFLVISQHHSQGSFRNGTPGAGGVTINDTAGFTSPKYNVSHVDVSATPVDGLSPGQDAVAIGSPASSPAGSATSATSPSLSHGVLQPESVSSVIVIIALWAARVYLTFIVLSYARFVLRQHISTSSRSTTYAPLHSGSSDPNLAENPFSPHFPEGAGLKGRVGRLFLSVGKKYWLGKDQDDAWISQLNEGGGRFASMRKSGGLGGGKIGEQTVEVPGVVERERRRRSGTGPPPMSAQLLQAGQGQGKHLRVTELSESR